MRAGHAELPISQLTAPPEDSPQSLGPAEEKDGVRLYRDVVYAYEVGYRPLRLDLYVPVHAQPAPVTLWMHGGGFLMGSRRRSDLSGPPWDALLARGIAVAVVEYRLSFEEIFPACLHDVKAAVRWLRKNGAELRLRPDAIGAWGESAGGFLAAFLALDGVDGVFDGEVGVTGVSSAVSAAVDWYGPTDFVHMDEQDTIGRNDPHDAPGSPESLLIGGAVQEISAVADAASPVTYATATDPAPLLIMHGQQDPWVPCGQSVVLAQALEAAGADVSLNLVPGAGHMFEGVDHGPIIAQAIDFLAAHFAR